MNCGLIYIYRHPPTQFGLAGSDISIKNNTTQITVYPVVSKLLYLCLYFYVVQTHHIMIKGFDTPPLGNPQRQTYYKQKRQINASIILLLFTGSPRSFILPRDDKSFYVSRKSSSFVIARRSRGNPVLYIPHYRILLCLHVILHQTNAFL